MTSEVASPAQQDRYLDGCPLCEQNRDLGPGTPDRELVQVTDHWRVLAHASGLPGWLLLFPLRHVGSLAELTPAESAELGPLLQQATAAMAAGLGAEKSYVLLFAEALKHAHFSLVPRMPAAPADRIGPAVVAYNSEDELISDERRDEVARILRTAWPG
jgi:diadenosine tetraphosphate (Ap4A) HIT family hydrolase